MNRRDFLKGLGLVAGAAAMPSAMVLEEMARSSANSHPDNPWLKHRIVESGYSKLRIEVVQKLKPLYSWTQPNFPVDFVHDRQIFVEFDVPPSVAALYDLGRPIPQDLWPHISNLWPTQVDLKMSELSSTAIVKAELFDPGDGIDIYRIEKVLFRTGLTS